MNKTFTFAGLYIGASLMLCSIIFSFIITPITIKIGDIPVEIISAVINLIGAIIVYHSFKEQRKANKIQIDALAEERNRTNSLNKFNQLITLMQECDTRYENFSVYYISKVENMKVTLKGKPAHDLFVKDLQILQKDELAPHQIPDRQDKMGEFKAFLNLLNFVIKGILEYTNKEDHSKDVLRIKFIEYFIKYGETLSGVRNASKDIPSNMVFLWSLGISSETLFKNWLKLQEEHRNYIRATEA